MCVCGGMTIHRGFKLYDYVESAEPYFLTLVCCQSILVAGTSSLTRSHTTALNLDGQK